MFRGDVRDDKSHEMRQPNRTGVASKSGPEPEGERRYQAIFTRLLRNDLVGFVLINRRTGHIEDCNRKFAEFFGRLPSSLVGRHVSEFESFFASREQYNHLLLTWASGAPLRNLRISSALPDGSRRHGVITVESLPEADGMDAWDVALLADISDQARLEDQLKQSERLERIGRLAGEVADEVQSLLGAIANSADQLHGAAASDARRHEALDEIKRAASRAGALIGIFVPGELAPDLEADAAPPGPAGEVAVITGTETILYVEPDPSLAATTVSFLGYLGYRLIHGATPAEAGGLATSPDVSVDLVIAGVRTPNRSTAELIEELRHSKPHLPALLISDVPPSPLAPPDANTIVLMRPVAMEDLAPIVRRLLTSSAASPRG